MKTSHWAFIIVLALCLGMGAWFGACLKNAPSQPATIEIVGLDSCHIEGGLNSKGGLRTIVESAYRNYPQAISYRFAKEASGETVVASLNVAAEAGFTKIFIGCSDSPKVIAYDIKQLEKYFTLRRQPFLENQVAETDGMRVSQMNVHVNKGRASYMGKDVSLVELREKLMNDAAACDILTVDFIFSQDSTLSDCWEGIPVNGRGTTILIWFQITPRSRPNRRW